MKKQNIFEMLANVGAQVFDDSAITTKDIQKHLNCGHTKAREIASMNVKSGKWERVWKKVDSQTIQAYRLAK